MSSKSKTDGYSEVTPDLRLRMSLNALADKYNKKIREQIYRVYNDPEIASIYRGWRKSGEFEKGSKGNVRKKILEFPNAHVYDFVNTVLTTLYGPDWLTDKKIFKKAAQHELVKPWWVVKKI